jgi:hypothetical protein
VLGNATADLCRPDLAAAGMGNCAFAFPLEVTSDLIHISALVDGVELQGSPRPAPLLLQSALPIRRWLARQYCHGEGIEIGALHDPTPILGHSRNVDRLPRKELEASYRMKGALAEVDYVCDAQDLTVIPNGSQAYLIANHILEHMENPLLALRNWLRVVRPGGCVFVTVPDKRYTFDRPRAITPFTHVLQDFEKGPAWSRLAHFRDWVDSQEPEHRGNESRVRHLMDVERYPIHYHVWTPREVLEIVAWTGAELATYKHTPPEMVFVLIA